MNNVSMSYSKKVSDTNSHANKMNNENKRLEDAENRLFNSLQKTIN